MKIGIVGSSNGGTFKEFFRGATSAGWPKESFVVVTDRACGLTTFCKNEGIQYRLIENKNNAEFSSLAKDFLLEQDDVQAVLLYFTRLLTADLFSEIPTYNIHPSLLPAFSGFRAIERSKEHGVRFLGATLHLVDEFTDMGPIVCQTCTPVDPAWDIEQYHKISFIQRVYLSFLFSDLLKRNQLRGSKTFSITTPTKYSQIANPAIHDTALLTVVHDIQRREGVLVF